MVSLLNLSDCSNSTLSLASACEAESDTDEAPSKCATSAAAASAVGAVDPCGSSSDNNIVVRSDSFKLYPAHSELK